VSPLLLSGSGVVSAAGIGLRPMAAALRAGQAQTSDVSRMYDETLPYPRAHALPGFDVRTELGRKGTSFLDRSTALALVAAGAAIRDGGLELDEQSRSRIGVVLGTTVGSLRSSTDYSRETLTNERPYLVNGGLFPNTVMNCASGQVAIRYGLRGVNATVATGRLGLLGALRYAANALRRGYAETMLVGAVEELTPPTAWTHARLERAGCPGEGAAVFVLAGAAVPGRAGVELLAAGEGYHPGGDPAGVARALAGCARGALRRAGVEASAVTRVALSEAWNPRDEGVGAGALRELGLEGRPSLRVREILGDCGAAGAALQLAALLALWDGPDQDGPDQDGPDQDGQHQDGQHQDGDVALIAGWSGEGAVAAAVLRRWPDVGADRQ
jgi:3-oxoacyl-[acyl-carrier-protein] synthase II